MESFSISRNKSFPSLVLSPDAGYGSIHDGDQFVIAICDDCIKENLEDATLLYYGNYMYDLDVTGTNEKEKSKQKYRRRKNLDNII